MPSSIGSRPCDVEARERLKRYLEQRRELGERELVLDGMTVEDVMKIVGAAGMAPRADRPGMAADEAESGSGGRTDAAFERSANDASTDWREALRASGVDPAVADRPARKSARPADPGPTPVDPPIARAAPPEPAASSSPAAPASKRYEFPAPADAVVQESAAPTSAPPAGGSPGQPADAPVVPPAPAGL